MYDLQQAKQILKLIQKTDLFKTVAIKREIDPILRDFSVISEKYNGPNKSKLLGLMQAYRNHASKDQFLQGIGELIKREGGIGHGSSYAALLELSRIMSLSEPEGGGYSVGAEYHFDGESRYAALHDIEADMKNRRLKELLIDYADSSLRTKTVTILCNNQYLLNSHPEAVSKKQNSKKGEALSLKRALSFDADTKNWNSEITGDAYRGFNVVVSVPIPRDADRCILEKKVCDILRRKDIRFSSSRSSMKDQRGVTVFINWPNCQTGRLNQKPSENAGGYLNKAYQQGAKQTSVAWSASSRLFKIERDSIFRGSKVISERYTREPH